MLPSHPFGFDTDQYQPIVDALEPRLRSLLPILVGIDGPRASGKTTLGRFLAWWFNCTHLETDRYLLSGGGYNYMEDALVRGIDGRLSSGRPVIVDGVALLRLLKHLKRPASFLVYVDAEPYDGYDAEYVREFKPQQGADVVVQLRV